MSRGIQVLSALFIWLALVASAQAEKRVALVIGNAGYQSVPRLANPTNDAAAIGASFQRLGFTVTSLNDLGFDAMRRALKDFAGAAAGADIAIIYFAGHGMEIGGENYLVPVDAKLATDVDVPYEAISINLALGTLEGARGTRLLILDACRDNPFLAKMRIASKTRSIGRGLTRVEPAVGTMVAYAAREGTVAEDGDAEHSPFTRALLKHIEEPGVDVQFLFREVHDTVMEETNGSQEPFTYGALPGRAVLLSPPKEPAPLPAPAVTDAGNEIAAEVAFWNTIKDSHDRGLLESYLTQYPSGRFAALAKIFIGRIDSDAAKPSKATEVPLHATALPAPPTGPAAVDNAPSGPPPSGGKPPEVPSREGTGIAVADAGGSEPHKTPADAGALPGPVSVDTGDKANPPDAGAAAKDGAGAPPIGPLASLPPSGTPEAGVNPSPDLVRNIQNELLRVGCSAGSSDGRWGKKGRSAVEAFARYAKISVASLDPSEDLLSTLKSYGGRACPLVCGARYEPKGDSCVLKTCPSGQTLTGRGDCFAPAPPKQKQAVLPPPPSGSKKKATPTGGSGGSGGGCQRETEQQCIGRLSANHGGASLFGHGGMDDFQIAARCSAPANRICR